MDNKQMQDFIKCEEAINTLYLNGITTHDQHIDLIDKLLDEVMSYFKAAVEDKYWNVYTVNIFLNVSRKHQVKQVV